MNRRQAKKVLRKSYNAKVKPRNWQVATDIHARDCWRYSSVKWYVFAGNFLDRT